jgi:hypothetical protein
MAHKRKKRRSAKQIAATKHLIAHNKKHGHKKSRKKRAKHHGPVLAGMRHVSRANLAHFSRGTKLVPVSAVKHAIDKASSEMRKMAAHCKTEIAKAKRGAGKKRKKTRRKKARKKTHHKKHHTHAKHHAHKTPHHHKKKTHRKKTHRKGHKKHHGEKTITAATLLGGRRKGKKRVSMKRWVCEAPVRTGCGGGASGGHVLGDLSSNTARRLRR